MMKKIKRIAALTVAGILLICISFAALAEETPEENGTPAETEASVVSEAAVKAEDAPAEAGEADAPAESGETVPEKKEAENAEQSNSENSAPETAEDKQETPDDDYDTVIDDYDAGSVDPELISIYFPNGGGAPSEKDEAGETEADEARQDEAAPAANRAWIEASDNRDDAAGEKVTLLAKAEQELNGAITWQIRDTRWEENVWQDAGTGEFLELDVPETNAEILVRFTAEDGTVSETFEMMQAEEAEEAAGEAGTQDRETDEKEEQTEVRNDRTEEGNDVNPEATADEPSEETAAETTRAWITAEYAGELPEGTAVTLTANAEPEMTGVNIWETRTDDAEEGAWTRIGYGDQITVENAGENFSGIYRFTMQDGTVSEEYRLTSADETADTAGEAEEDEAADAAEETETTENEEDAEAAEEIPFPANARVSFDIDWEGKAAIGGTAVFTAAVEGLDAYEYSMQWQWSTDSENWQDVDGETGIRMRQVITEENMGYFWRINITVTGTAEAETLL